MHDPIIGTNDYEEYLDKHVTILLWEGKYLYGILRSYDQFTSITLENTVERNFFEDVYGEINHGLYVVRGENIVLMGLGSNDFSMYRFREFDDVEEMRRGQSTSGGKMSSEISINLGNEMQNSL